MQGESKKSENRFGQMGEPLNRSHPFMFGFLAAFGVLTAMALTFLR
jgi:hypothetical protein